MNTLLLLNRGLSTATLTLPNNRRSVGEMSDEQRKAVMAKLGGGGGGGAGRGYTGGARGGKRGPVRNRPTEVTPEGHARAVRDAQIGLQSDLTPFDLLASSVMEESLDQINLARMNTDNKWVDAALGVAALGLFAAGIKNARARTQVARRLEAQKTVDQVLEQMGRDAARFDSMLTSGSPVADDIYRSYDKLAERVTRARGYPPSFEEANRWLDKVAPKVSDLDRVPKAQPRPASGGLLSSTGIPPSPAGDAFRAEAAKRTGSQRSQMLDYARRADQDAIQPRMVKDPWSSTKEALERIDMPDPVTPARRPPLYDFVTDDPEFYRWYEYGGKPRPKPLTDQELKAVIGNTARSGRAHAEPVRLIRNAVKDFRSPFLANAMPMQEDQRKAMFAKFGGRGGSAGLRAATPSSYAAPSQTQRGHGTTSVTMPHPGRIPGAAQPPKKITFTGFNNMVAAYEAEFGKHNGGIVDQMQRILGPFAENPSNILADPTAINSLFKVISPAIVGNTGAKNYDSKRAAMESHFYSEGLKILQAAGLMTEWKGVSTSGPGGFFGVRFTNNGPLPLTDYARPPRVEYPSPAPASPGSGGGSSFTPPSYVAPRGGGIGYFNPNQPYQPGQPRTNIDGSKTYGPRPGEPGFIDIGSWRKGALPVVPGKSKPSLEQKPSGKK